MLAVFYQSLFLPPPLYIPSTGNRHISEEDYLSITRLTLLAADAGILTPSFNILTPGSDSSQTSLQSVLTPVVDVLMTVNSHAYMPPEKAERAMVLLTRLVQEAEPVEGTVCY